MISTLYVKDRYIFVLTTFPNAHKEISKNIQIHGFFKSFISKKVRFSNMNNTKYTHLTNEF